MFPAEMGADFNILEYADPELDALTGGEKTNILDSLDLEESEPDKDEKKDIKPMYAIIYKYMKSILFIHLNVH